MKTQVLIGLVMGLAVVSACWAPQVDGQKNQVLTGQGAEGDWIRRAGGSQADYYCRPAKAV